MHEYPQEWAQFILYSWWNEKDIRTTLGTCRVCGDLHHRWRRRRRIRRISWITKRSSSNSKRKSIDRWIISWERIKMIGWVSRGRRESLDYNRDSMVTITQCNYCFNETNDRLILSSFYSFFYVRICMAVKFVLVDNILFQTTTKGSRQYSR